MKLLVDREICKLSQYGVDGVMIDPFEAILQTKGVVSYGVSSMGYDIRVSDEFRVFTNVYGETVDPKHMQEQSMVTMKVASYCIIPPNSFALGKSVERFKIPRNVLGLCVGKSTYARCGIIVNVTPLEPGWEGILTIEISNTTPLPAKVYANEGIAQVLFFEVDQEPMETYDSRKGKYQGQVGIESAKVVPLT